ncbi:hypothetical protein B0H66DRAFT_609530 [Apodospora peruviana]|uniref:Uncharacterized protein n=1 Tax=Apodospora peruviana TaxID=516989 RepID=A0AAE0IQ16_9PEZI|nr:hypothetical protein B0H66DRAFT_609530 [Apodospora peruviana]
MPFGRTLQAGTSENGPGAPPAHHYPPLEYPQGILWCCSPAATQTCIVPVRRISTAGTAPFPWHSRCLVPTLPMDMPVKMPKAFFGVNPAVFGLYYGYHAIISSSEGEGEEQTRPDLVFHSGLDYIYDDGTYGLARPRYGKNHDFHRCAGGDHDSPQRGKAGEITGTNLCRHAICSTGVGERVSISNTEEEVDIILELMSSVACFGLSGCNPGRSPSSPGFQAVMVVQTSTALGNDMIANQYISMAAKTSDIGLAN